MTARARTDGHLGVIGPLSFDLAHPVAAGAEWVCFEPSFLPHGCAPLLAGQFINIGGELRIVLDVGERTLRVAALDDSHDRSEYVWRPRQRQVTDGWYRL
jgi:hypothetical protein